MFCFFISFLIPFLGVDHGPGLDNHFPEHDSPEHDFHSYMKQGYNIENSNFLLGTPKIENGFIFSQLKVLMERLLEGRIASRAVNLPYFVRSKKSSKNKVLEEKRIHFFLFFLIFSIFLFVFSHFLMKMDNNKLITERRERERKKKKLTKKNQKIFIYFF